MNPGIITIPVAIINGMWTLKFSLILGILTRINKLKSAKALSLVIVPIGIKLKKTIVDIMMIHRQAFGVFKR